MPEPFDSPAACKTSIFGHGFGLPFTNSIGILQTLQLSCWLKLLTAYSPVLAALRPSPLPSGFLITDLRPCLPPLYYPSSLCTKSLSALFQHSTAPTAVTFNIAHCLTTNAKRLPSSSAWCSAYASDPSTDTLLSHLSSGLAWSPWLVISTLHSTFQPTVGTRQQLVHPPWPPCHLPKLAVRYFPSPYHHTLHRLIFDIFHGSPIGGHYGISKTLFPICI